MLSLIHIYGRYGVEYKVKGMDMGIQVFQQQGVITMAEGMGQFVFAASGNGYPGIHAL